MLATVRRICGRIMHLQPSLRSQWDKGWKNNSQFASPSIRRPTLKLDQKPENRAWTYDRIKDAYGASRTTIAGIAQRFVMEGMEAALGRKVQENRRRKVTGEVEARICAIACSEPPEGASRWTMQAIADELIRLEVVDYIT